MAHMYILSGGSEVSPLNIFDALEVGEEVPPEFNAVVISLNGRANADLDWKRARAAASGYSKQGLKIFWQMDLGLFDRLNASLSNQVQYLALLLSLDYFRDMIWKEFQSETIGVCLYRGRMDLCNQLVWDEQQESSLQGWLQDRFEKAAVLNERVGTSVEEFTQIDHYSLAATVEGLRLLNFFCWDVAAEFLTLLAARLPDGLQPFALFAAGSIENDPLLTAQLISKERFERIHCGVAENALFLRPLSEPILGFIGRKIQDSPFSSSKPIGVCLPLASLCLPKHESQLQLAIEEMQRSGILFRLISEATLTTEWDGLDYLIALSSCVSSVGMRKLHGFCAAGGVVVSIGDPIGLPNEQSFHDWYKELCNNKLDDWTA